MEWDVSASRGLLGGGAAEEFRAPPTDHCAGGAAAGAWVGVGIWAGANAPPGPTISGETAEVVANTELVSGVDDEGAAEDVPLGRVVGEAVFVVLAPADVDPDESSFARVENHSTVNFAGVCPCPPTGIES